MFNILSKYIAVGPAHTMSRLGQRHV